MKRDGALTSIWQVETVSTKENFLSADVYDVVIVGAGITGVSCAIQLASAGKNCLLLEAANVGFGSTGGTTAHLNTFFDASYYEVIKNFGLENARLLAHAGREALSIIRQRIMQYRISCDFLERSGYLFALDEKQAEELEKIKEGSDQVGITMQFTSKNPFPIPFTKMVAIPGQAQFHPIKYIQSLVQAYLEMGGNLVEQCRVLKAAESEEDITIETSKGTIKACHLIYATHIPPGISTMHFFNAPYRSYAIAVKLKAGTYPQALGYDLQDPYHYYRTQIIDGQEYLIAGGEDHKTGHMEDNGACFKKLEHYVRQYFDVKEVAYHWSSQYYIPTDGLPFIGIAPGNTHRTLIATGYNGNGMMFGTLAAKICADLIIKGQSEYRELFNPSRIKPMAGFSNTLKEALDVTVHFVKDKLSVEKINSLAELSDNEAKVVKYEGHSYAIFKDHFGTSHILKSSCTHMGCNVSWNSAEQSWDCPCHGARYDIEGNVLTAPAIKGLAQW
ncbi:MAG TPA: FAD-dependent oxidoreductase [Flavipsychrobacter sp.]|nr:FAD-dependent oxidoreductase [Flavipsychrobacter sp.]